MWADNDWTFIVGELFLKGAITLISLGFGGILGSNALNAVSETFSSWQKWNSGRSTDYFKFSGRKLLNL